MNNYHKMDTLQYLVEYKTHLNFIICYFNQLLPRRQVRGLIILILVYTQAFGWHASAQEAWGLKDIFKDRFLIGAALNASIVSSHDSKLHELIRSEFNAVVPENCMKAANLHPHEGVFKFQQADALVELAQRNGQIVTGHCLVWHGQAPHWMFVDKEGSQVSREILIQRMKDHIKMVVGHFRGKLLGWDVVNEAIEDDGTWRKTPWYNIIGEDYIALAFQFAHEADPDAELYYNDYNMSSPRKRNTVVRLIRDLQEKGIRIDGVGMQSHLTLDSNLEEYEESIKAFASTGIKVIVSELDINLLRRPDENVSAEIINSIEFQEKFNPYRNGLPFEVEKRQADMYQKLFGIFIKHSDVISRVSFWGVHDGASWLNDHLVRGRTNYPLLFDRQLNRKYFVDNVVLRPRMSIFCDNIMTLANQEDISFAEAARRVRKMGYEGVDVCVTINPEQMRILNDAGFKHAAAITYIDYSKGEMKEQENKTLEFMTRENFTRVLLVPGLSNSGKMRATKEKVLERLNRFSRCAAAKGFEVMIENFGDTLSPCFNIDALDKFFKASPSKKQTFETGSFFCGEDTKKTASHFAERISHVLLKYGVKTGNKQSPNDGTGIGTMKQVIKKILKQGYTGWFSIETFDNPKMQDELEISFKTVFD